MLLLLALLEVVHDRIAKDHTEERDCARGVGSASSARRRSGSGRDKFFPGEVVAVHGGLYDVSLDFADHHDDIYNESGGTMRWRMRESRPRNHVPKSAVMNVGMATPTDT